MKYIDAEKLIAEIERRMSENCELGKKAECFSHRAVEDNDILALIDSLQHEQPEVDLEREIIKYKVPFTDERECLNETTLDAIARHFWNKGYNARKED